MIRTECTTCSKEYRLKNKYAQQWVRCRECGSAFQVEARYTERFERFLERAPKPATPHVPRPKHKRELPLAPAAVTVPPAAPTAFRRLLDRHQPRLRLVGVGVGGIAVMALASVMAFFVASVALGNATLG